MAGELAIEVRQLVKQFGGRVTAVDRLDLSVRRRRAGRAPDEVH